MNRTAKPDYDPMETVPSVDELKTEPDLVEMAEELAEQFRSSLYENQGLEDQVNNLLSGYILNREDDPDGNASDLAYDEGQKRAAQALHQLLLPMVAKVFADGDWTGALESEETIEGPKIGILYRVRYRQQSGNYQWYDWTMIALFLGQVGDNYSFSLRPKMGTTEVPIQDIKLMTVANAGAQAILPTCRPGAVKGR